MENEREEKNITGFAQLFFSWDSMGDNFDDEKEYHLLKINTNDDETLADFCRRVLRKDIEKQIPAHQALAKVAAYYGYHHFDKNMLENTFDRYLITVTVPEDVKKFFRIIIKECFDESV